MIIKFNQTPKSDGRPPALHGTAGQHYLNSMRLGELEVRGIGRRDYERSSSIQSDCGDYDRDELDTLQSRALAGDFSGASAAEAASEPAPQEVYSPVAVEASVQLQAPVQPQSPVQPQTPLQPQAPLQAPASIWCAPPGVASGDAAGGEGFPSSSPAHEAPAGFDQLSFPEPVPMIAEEEDEEEDEDEEEIEEEFFHEPLTIASIAPRGEFKTDILRIPTSGVVRSSRGTVELLVHEGGRNFRPFYNHCGMLTAVEVSDGMRFSRGAAGSNWVITDREGNRVSDSEIDSVAFDKRGNLWYRTVGGIRTTFYISGETKVERVDG